MNLNHLPRSAQADGAGCSCVDLQDALTAAQNRHSSLAAVEITARSTHAALDRALRAHGAARETGVDFLGLEADAHALLLRARGALSASCGACNGLEDRLADTMARCPNHQAEVPNGS